MGLKELSSRIKGPEAAQLAQARRLGALGRELSELNPGWSGPPDTPERISQSLAELELAVKNIDGRLIMGLLGGTGVGKSTLISALAGEEISKSSPVRPTTSRPVVYRHRDFPWPEKIDGLDAPHRVEALRHLAIIDFPDFDSLETRHQQLVLDSLKDLDLVLWVSDQHKYADRRLYEVMNQVRASLGSAAQAAVLNKADELMALDDGREALDYVLESFYRQLQEFGGWSGAEPWPVSALEALGRPGERQAGGFGPLRDLIDELADAKYRRSIELGNIEARLHSFSALLRSAARPEKWLAELEHLENLKKNFAPEKAASGDLAALALSRPSYIAPRLDSLKKEAKGPLSLFTDGWDFVLGRFKPGPDLPPPAPRPTAPNLVHYLLGREEDLAAVVGRSPALNKEALAEESSALIQKALDDNFSSAGKPRTGSALLYLWPLALALLMVWAETGGVYGGPAALLAAMFRAAVPWLIFGFLGDLFLSRFIWFRARRHYEKAFHKALAQAEKDLAELAEHRLGREMRAIAAARVRGLDLLADIASLEADG